MKRILLAAIFVLSLSLTSFCQSERDSIEASVAKFFDGISEIDAGKMKAYSTGDFSLLEDGKVWILDTLIAKISFRKNSGIKRVNSFQFISKEHSGNIAWVSYFNTANFSLGDKQQTVKWLESAVLKKEKGRWKIQLLHSTKIVAPKGN